MQKPSPSRSLPLGVCLEQGLADDLADGLNWEDISAANDDTGDASVPWSGGVSETGGGQGRASGGAGADPPLDDLAHGLVWEEIIAINGDDSVPRGRQGSDRGDGEDLNDMFRIMGWDEELPPLGQEDEFEALPEHLADMAVPARPAARAAVEQLQVVTIRAEEAAELCIICSDSFLQGGLGTQLSCEHLYHEKCIVPWLALRNKCPVCCYELPTDNPDYEARRASR